MSYSSEGSHSGGKEREQRQKFRGEGMLRKGFQNVENTKGMLLKRMKHCTEARFQKGLGVGAPHRGGCRKSLGALLVDPGGFWGSAGEARVLEECFRAQLS